MSAQLQLKHLLPYFPHNLMCQVTDKGEIRIAELNAIYNNGSCSFHNLVESDKGFDCIKPILKKHCRLEIENIWEKHSKTDPDVRTFLNAEFLEEKGFNTIDEILGFNPQWWPVGTLNVLAKYHFDIYDLISKGLAV